MEILVQSEQPRMRKAVCRIAGVAGGVLLVVGIVALTHTTPDTTQTVMVTTGLIEKSALASQQCTSTCVVPSDKSDLNDVQYMNARAWLCGPGMQAMGEKCSDFTSTLDDPFDAYYQHWKGKQGDKACCFGNNDGIHDCLAHVETKCCTSTCVVPSDKANSNDIQYTNARNWLCGTGMQTLGKKCSDFTSPFDAYFQHWRGKQGDKKACCFGNNDGTACLTHLETKCSVKNYKDNK